MKICLNKALCAVATVLTMMASTSAVARVDVNITVPGAYVPQQQVVVQQQPVYVRPQRVYVDRRDHNDNCRDGRCHGRKYKKEKHHKHDKHHGKHGGHRH